MERSKNKSSHPAPYLVLLQSGERVDLVKAAHQFGHANLPETSATEPTEVETCVVRQHDQDHVRKAEETNNVINERAAACRQIEQRLPSTADLENHIHQAESDLEAELAGHPEVVRLRRDERSALRSLRVYQRKHRLDRDAHWPESAWMHYGLVVFIALVEFIANAIFFADGNTLGIAGGLVLALLLVLFNVGSGFWVGKAVVPNRQHIEPARRMRANFLIGLYVAVVLAANLMVAHYRDLCVNGLALSGDVAGELIRSPFDLSVHSMLLFLLGTLAALLMVWKAFKSDDPYPHYGDNWRRCRLAHTAYEEAKAQMLGRMLDRAKAIPAACDDTVGQTAESIKQMEREYLGAQAELDGYDTSRQHYEQQCHVLLIRFREENCVVRDTDAPEYFKQFPTFADLSVRGEVTGMCQRLQFHRRHLQDLQATAARIKSEGPRRIAEVAGRFDRFVDDHCQRVDEQMRKDDGLDGEASALQEVRA